LLIKWRSRSPVIVVELAQLLFADAPAASPDVNAPEALMLLPPFGPTETPMRLFPWRH